MNTKESKPNRRIVSKEDYLARVAKREAKRWGSVGMSIAVAACFVCGGGCIFGIFFAGSTGMKGVSAIGAILAFLIGCGIMQVAEKNMQEALIKLDVVPLTRANQADLPAPEVLVRPSQEPAQTQRTQLLRAAQNTAETPAEELLRASITDGRESLQ